MGSQEEKERKIRRIRNHIAKDLRREAFIGWLVQSSVQEAKTSVKPS